MELSVDTIERILKESPPKSIEIQLGGQYDEDRNMRKFTFIFSDDNYPSTNRMTITTTDRQKTIDILLLLTANGFVGGSI